RADIAEKEAVQQRRRELDARRLTDENRQAERPNAGGRVSTAGPRVEVTRENFIDDPKRGFRDHREFLAGVMKAGLRGSTDDHRLKSLILPSYQATAGSDEAGTYSDPYGGFFVPSGLSPGPLRLDPEADPMAGRVRSVPMDVPTLSFNARVDKDHSSSVSGGLQVYRRKETQTVSATRTEFEQVKLEATGLFGVSYATEELLSRSLVSFIALLEAGFSDEFVAKMVNERINGTGTGEFEGVLNTACLISVTKETGQAAATIEKENIDKMQERCWRYGSAIWLANHSCIPQLKSMVQVIGTAGVTVPYFSMTPDGQAMLDGRPLFFTEYCAALGTVGDLILSNWSEYLEGTLTSQNSAESMHVRFLEHERTFKFWLENDAKCWWRSALTPKNGNTRSPFVVLATRA
ncbi:MAG TPA: phage major capsid protein, partial [Pirellulales bacterium]|nr:phage major capsid protein [Pirellulales bacterium]